MCVFRPVTRHSVVGGGGPLPPGEQCSVPLHTACGVVAIGSHEVTFKDLGLPLNDRLSRILLVLTFWS